MKKIHAMLEDLWVAVAFAEAGAYEVLQTKKDQPLSHVIVRVSA
jgi:hypothetical protein